MLVKIAYSAEKFGSDTLILLDFCSVFEKIFGPSGLFGSRISDVGCRISDFRCWFRMWDIKCPMSDGTYISFCTKTKKKSLVSSSNKPTRKERDEETWGKRLIASKTEHWSLLWWHTTFWVVFSFSSSTTLFGSNIRTCKIPRQNTCFIWLTSTKYTFIRGDLGNDCQNSWYLLVCRKGLVISSFLPTFLKNWASWNFAKPAKLHSQRKVVGKVVQLNSTSILILRKESFLFC